jgi:glycosyltransferase involved in cell wall biosynthesis
MTDPKVSVVIPTYNRPLLVQRAVNSVLRQTYKDYEIIVVDDGSSTEPRFTGSIPSSRFRIIRNSVNGGPARARNLGISAARGGWIAFLDDDDEYCPDFLAQTVSCLSHSANSPTFSWCSVCVLSYNADRRMPAAQYRRFTDRQDDWQCLFTDAVSIGAGFGLTIDAQCLAIAGTFDPSYGEVEDTELILRLLSRGYIPIAIEPVLIRVHDHFAERRTMRDVQWRIRDCERLLSSYSEFLNKYIGAAIF